MLCGLAAFRAQRIVWLPLAVLWLLLGAWCAWMEPHPAPAPALAALSDGLLRTVEGTVVDAGPVRGETEQNLDEHDSAQPAAAATDQRPSQRIDLRVSCSGSGHRHRRCAGAHRRRRAPDRSLAGSRARPAHPRPFHCGERLRAVVRLLPPEVYHDPGVWSREDFLLDQGITSTATVNIDRVDRLGPSPGAFLACRVSGLQHASSARLLALPAAMRRLPAPLRLSQDDAIMLAAMVTGDRTFLTHSLRVGFERTGSFHMLVVSGFHLAIVAGCIFWVARRLRLPRVPATFVTILASFAYALFTGFATPVQRSLWMVTLYLLGRLALPRAQRAEHHRLCRALPAGLQPPQPLRRQLPDDPAGRRRHRRRRRSAASGHHPSVSHGYARPALTSPSDAKLAPLPGAISRHAAHDRSALGTADEAIPGEDKMHPKLALSYAILQMPVQAWQIAADAHFASRIIRSVFPWTVRFMLWVAGLVAVSCVVELAMALPMAIYFHRITVFALPVNVFILPLLVVLMPAALITLLFALIGPAYAVVPAMFVAFPLHFGTGWCVSSASLALGDFRIPAPLLWQSLAFCALLAAAIVLASWNPLAASLRLGRSRSRRSWPPLCLAPSIIPATPCSSKPST